MGADSTVAELQPQTSGESPVQSSMSDARDKPSHNGFEETKKRTRVAADTNSSLQSREGVVTSGVEAELTSHNHLVLN